jgi:signal transduction histidine kinase
MMTIARAAGCRGGRSRLLTLALFRAPADSRPCHGRRATASAGGRARARITADVRQLSGADALALLAHDLCRPLARIRGSAYLLGTLVSRTPDEEADVERWLERLDSATTEMAAMIDEIRDLASVEAGCRLDLRRQPTDLVALLCRLVDKHQQDCPSMALLWEAHPAPMVAVCDARRLERVLDNLIHNAVKYSPHGGEIRIDARPGLPAEGSGPHEIVITIADRGIGIPVAEVSHVFELFYRASNVAGRIKGMGIGLAGAKQIVEQHAGSITVSSEEDKGSTFTVRLPLVS